MRAGSRPARRGLPRRLLWASLFIVPCTLLWFTHTKRVGVKDRALNPVLVTDRGPPTTTTTPTAQLLRDGPW